MPDDQGKLTQEEKEAAFNKIVGKHSGLTCPMCNDKSRKWAVQNHVVSPVAFGSGFNMGGIAYPQIMLICANCNQTVFFSAVALGLYPKSGGTDAG